MKATKKAVKLLAARWIKDERTIRKWIEEKNPMLEHPESAKILNDNMEKPFAKKIAASKRMIKKYGLPPR